LTDPLFADKLLHALQSFQTPQFAVSASFCREFEFMRQAESAIMRYAEGPHAYHRIAELFHEGGGFHAILRQASAFEENLRQTANISAPWRGSYEAIAGLQESMGESLHRAIASAAKMSFASELAMERALLQPPTALSSSLELAFSQTRQLTADLCSAYCDHLQTFSVQGMDFFAAPAVVTHAPPREMFLSSYSLDRFVDATGSEDEEAPVNADLADLASECSTVCGSVPKMLEAIDPAFVALWKGACNALESTNADRIRHFATSIRDLFTHLLQRLAPTEAIQSWSQSKDDFSDGRPTRRARLRYICRNVAGIGKEYREFVELDIEAGLKLIKLYHQGTHELVSSLSRAQLSVMRLRMEAMFIFLIDIARTSEAT
jgi:hypothetical protein